MSLRHFIIGVCSLILVVFLVFFYTFSKRIVAARFKDVQEMHLRSVGQVARSVLEAKKYLMMTLGESRANDARLAKYLMMRNRFAESQGLAKELERFKAETRVSFVDVVDGFAGKPVID